MSVPAEKMQQINSMKTGQVYIVGKIDNVRKFDSKFYTRVIMPAVDEYSSPAFVEIESSERLGDVEDVLKCTAVLTGFRNDFRMTDKESGETRAVKSARVGLKYVK